LTALRGLSALPVLQTLVASDNLIAAFPDPLPCALLRELWLNGKQVSAHDDQPIDNMSAQSAWSSILLAAAASRSAAAKRPWVAVRHETASSVMNPALPVKANEIASCEVLVIDRHGLRYKNRRVSSLCFFL